MKNKTWLAVFCLLIAACSQAQPATVPTASPTHTPTVAPTLTPTATLNAIQQAVATQNIQKANQPKFPMLEGTPLPNMDYPVINSSNIGRLKLLARWGKGRATHAEFSPDGKLALVTSASGLYLFDADNLDLKQKLTDEQVYASFINTGAKVVSTSGNWDNPELKVWDVETGQQLVSKNLTLHASSPFNDIIVAEDYQKGDVLIMNSDLEIMDTITTKDLESFAPDLLQDGSIYILNAVVKISRDGSQIFLTSRNSNARFYMYAIDSQGSITPLKQKHAFSPFSMAFSSDNQFVVTTSGEGSRHETISFSKNDTDLNFIDNSFSGAKEPNNVNFTADGKHIYFSHGANNDLTRVIDIDNQSFKDFAHPLNAVLAVSPDGKKALVASTNLDLVDLTADKTLVSKPDTFSSGLPSGWHLPSMQVTNDMIVFLGGDKLVHIISLKDGTFLNTYPADSFSYSAEKNLLVIFNKETVSILDPKTGEIKTKVDFPDLDVPISWLKPSIAISSHGDVIAAYSLEKQRIYLLSPNDLSIMEEIPWSSNAFGIPVLKFSPDGNYMIAYNEKGLSIIKNTDAKPNRLINNEFVHYAAFSNTGENLVYVTDQWSPKVNWCEFNDGITSCRLIPDVQLYTWNGSYSLSPDNALFIRNASEIFSAYHISDWSVATEFKIKDYYDYFLSQSEFSPDGRFIVNATEDGFINIWGIKP